MGKITKKILFMALALTVLTLSLAGCAADKVTLEELLPRSSVEQASISFLNAGVGENIPRANFSAQDANFTALCDLLYGAAPVTVEIPSSYSPEVNASHEIALTTSGGTMALYYDDYQNLINVPINRRIQEESVRVYLSFQAAGLSEALEGWMPAGDANGDPQPPADPQQTPQSSFPPDDSALRATIDAAQLTSIGTQVAYEGGAYARQGDGAVYYVFTAESRPELTAEQALVVAAPAAADPLRAMITGIDETENYLAVRVALSEAEAGQEPSAVLCARADLDKGKPVVFVDGAGNLLYAQTLSSGAGDVPAADDPATDAPAENAPATDAPAAAGPSAQPSAAPSFTPPPTAPSTAAGGEVGSDEPLQP